MKAIILGAGEGYAGLNEISKHPKAIHEITQGKKLLDILIENFTQAGVDEIIFVGGFQIEKIIKEYPHIKHYFNQQWENSNILQSLFLCKKELTGDVIISYADTLYSFEVIQDIIQGKGDIRISEDKNWLNRYERRGKHLIQSAEKIISKNNILYNIGIDSITIDEATGEFTGLIYANSKGSQKIQETLEKLDSIDHQIIQNENIVAFLKRLIDSNESINTCETHGKWAELEAPQDIAQFVFGTKAETLFRLHKLITKAKIEDQVSFTLKQWNDTSDTIIQKVQETFKTGDVVVRSSAIGEDSFESSNAGEFSSFLNIDVTNSIILKETIIKVFDSYHSTNPDHQCLIQPQIQNVLSSGVIFTRDLETGAPYYIINYDISDKTDTITSGTSTTSKTLVYYKYSNVPFQDLIFNHLIEAVKEIEKVVGHDSLDIEFATSKDGIHILQVRPLVANRKNRNISDEDFKFEIEGIKEYIDFCKYSDSLQVQGTVLANMPDWNPAEIIGVAPKPLALSLYQYLITDEIWRKQRSDFGYRNSFPQPLVISLAGQPYIDTKASFNSFIPASLDENIALKLLNYYINKLSTNPHLHDKVEFDIAYTCFSFDLKERLLELKKHQFTDEEIHSIYTSLRDQSKTIIQPQNKYIQNSLDQINILIQKREKYASKNLSQITDKSNTIYQYLEECKEYGTLPFAKLARCAFIATDILKSLVRLEIISKNDYDQFFNSLETVASEFSKSLNLMRSNQLSLEQFLKSFGHLRPGTYDILSKRYDEAPDTYFGNSSQFNSNTNHSQHFELSETQRQNIQKLIQDHELKIEVSELFEFIQLAIINREYSKFEFTKNLSDSLSLISILGEQLNINKEDMSYLTINHIVSLNKHFPGKHILIDEWIELIKRNKIKHKLTRSLKLPHLIKDSNDIELFWLEDGKPNFITEKCITDQVVYLSLNDQQEINIKGKIVLIDNADPGYDWIFGHEIHGLITIYGGANSHMAIRSAEFALPAAIGCGEKIGDKLKKANILELNCQNRIIKVIS